MGKTTKWTLEKFVNECKKVYGDKYDYSKTVYKNQQSKVIVICKIHGEFEQWAQHYLKGVGCPKCVGRNLTQDEIIIKLNKIHNNKYDYSKIIYKNQFEKVIIICPEHGEFKQNINTHLQEIGCPKCVGKNKNDDEIIEQFKKIHGNKYDYSKVHYTGPKNKLIIICPEHGEFKQLYNNHLKYDCPKCCGKYKTNESIIKEFRKIHGDKYDYSKVNYISASKKIIIICPDHGEFLQVPNSHLSGSGCRKCWGNYNMTTNEFIERSKMIYGNLYDYSKVDYKRSDIKVIIICKKHGEFKKTPEKHLICLEGCPFCKRSKGEIKIKSFLDKYHIIYESQKSFKKCKHKGLLYFDFYLSNYNLCIEYDGIHHFESFDIFGGEKIFEEQKIRDLIKTTFCQENNIKLIRINYKDNMKEKLQWLMNYLKIEKQN